MNAQCNSFEHDLQGTTNQKNSLPAQPWSLTSIILRLKHFMFEVQTRRESRDAFKHLLSLDDSLLRDIGVSRADVEWAASLPLSVNASGALKDCAIAHKKLKDLV